MDKTESLLNNKLFSAEDRKNILKDERMRSLFISAGLAKTYPTFLNSCWTLDKWQAREKAGGIDMSEFYFEDMANNGGKCDVCDKPWEKVTNSLGLWHYEPNCTCYPRCPWCKRWLINEVKNKEAGCRHCCKNGIECWRIVPVMKKDEDGNLIKTKKRKKCTGILKLESAQNGYTIFSCSSCSHVLKRKIK